MRICQHELLVINFEEILGTSRFTNVLIIWNKICYPFV